VDAPAEEVPAVEYEIDGRYGTSAAGEFFQGCKERGSGVRDGISL